MASEIDVTEFYDGRVRGFRSLHETSVRRWRRLANLRLAAFILLAASVWWAATSGDGTRLLAALAIIVTLAGFVSLVALSSRARTAVSRFADLIAMNEEGVHRVRREWSHLEQRAWSTVPASHPYATDLDVFGTASLVRLFPALSVAPGRTTLSSWLLAPGTPAELQLRQQAVAELKDRVDFRDELVLHTRRISISAERLVSFQDWAAQSGWSAGNQWLTTATIAIPATAVLLAILQAFDIVGHAFWLVPLALGAMLTMRFRKPLRIMLAQVQGQRNVLRGYASIARLVSHESFTAPLLVDLRTQLGAGTASAAHRMRSLETLADCTDVRLSPMLHFIVQALTMWDFHVVRRLNDWRHDAGEHVGKWMSAIGALESLAALATVAHDNPDWVFPTINTTGPARIDATALGHPLLSARSRVANDVSVGPPGTLIFVTGSNMAGKSTLLRAIGLNVVLAQAGSVVCASSMTCPPVSLYTSMRVQDSLERGVSYFMAELERLKLIVDAADTIRATNGRTLVYLLDEILHGTNSVERAIAARHVLMRLVELGAIGAVTSHDLQLADTEEFARIAQHVHFQEDFSRNQDGRPAMHFDYRLRPGKATSSNALKLLELVGLAVGLSPNDYPISPD